MNYNVCETARYEDAVFYKILCKCGSDDHTITLELECDKDLEMLFLHVYTKLAWNVYWDDMNPLKRFLKKITACLKIIFTGQIEMEEDLVIDGERHINSLIQALEEGKELLSQKTAK